MYRRRRKPRVVWLPVPGTLYNAHGSATVLDPPTTNPNPIEFKFDLDVDTPVVVNAPMVVDQPTPELLTGGASLVTYQGQSLNLSTNWGYRLRRIVGDIFVAGQNANDQAVAPAGAFLTAGIMVRRVDEATGLMVSDGQPNSIQNVPDPWIWRRSWLLGIHGDVQEATRPTSHDFLNAFPNSNAEYGTKWHTAVDQKTARRIGPDERLFFSIGGYCVPFNRTIMGGNGVDGAPSIYFVFDYRVLGTLSLNSGNRRNASR